MASKPRKNIKPENHNLLSKADIAEMLNISSQLLANKASRAAERGEYFPEPTYSNQTGTVTLYTIEDAKEVYEYVTKAERERLAKAAAAFEKFNTGLTLPDGKPVEEPTLNLAEKPEEKPAAKVEPKPEVKEAPKVEPKEAPKTETPAKPATKPAESKPVAVTDAKAPEVKADAAKTAPRTTPAGNKTAPAGNQAAPAANQATPAAKAPAKATGEAFGIKK